MTDVNGLKEIAGIYSLDSLKKAVEGRKPFGRGMEGEVYRLDDGLAVKFRRGIGAGYDQIKDNLAEHQRQAVHDAVNSLANNKIEWEIRNPATQEKQKLTSKLIDILAAFVNGKESVSIMRFCSSRTLDYCLEIPGMFKAYKRMGVCGDFHGENVMYGPWGEEVDYLVLETWGKLHPDIFKSIERINPKNKGEVLGHLARAHLFGGTSQYPTPHKEMAGVVGFSYRPIDWHDVALVSKANGHKEITYDNLESCLAIAREKLTDKESRELSLCGLSDYEWGVMGIPAVREARQLFGGQFIPVGFDWENGSNLDVYGTDHTLYNEFRLAVDKVRPEIQPIKDDAKRKMGEK